LDNLRARLGLTMAMVLAATSFLTATMVTETNAAVETRSYDRHLASLGYYILMVGTAKDAPTPLTTADCDALGAINGVRAALWLGPAGDGRWIDENGPPVPIRAIGGDVEQFLAISNPTRVSSWDGASLLIDEGSVMAAGRIGDSFTVRFHPANGAAVSSPAMVVSLTMLGSGMAGNAVVVTSSVGKRRPVEVCLVIADGEARSGAMAAVSVVYPATSGYTHRWVLGNADQFESPTGHFEHRQSQWMWLIAAAAFLVFWGMNLRLRRPEFGVYAISGAQPRDLLILMGTEFAAIIGVSVGLTTIVVGAKAVSTGVEISDLAVGIRAASRFLIMVIVGSGALTMSECSRLLSSGLETLKDR